ncbi:MAG TPA: response regulator [Anaerolineales bacterium]|nr:response regulator [Anaerolineales bacterium]HNQ93289.1 response regulator [Anaerolineales bacterium]HNS59860.1 response regulator [Anaerolineales bacterium]
MKPISILVVDDEPGIASLCKRILDRSSYEVTALTDPSIAINYLQQNRYDLLLVDIRMPEVDGFDVISRAKIAQPEIAVLVMTGFGTVETAIRALRQGVDGLLLKPFENSGELLESVRQAFIDNQRKRDTARVQALRPLFNVTESLFAETDLNKLLDLILSAIREHLHCTHAAIFQVKDGQVATIAQIGSPLPVGENTAAANLIDQVNEDGNPFIIHATGPGEQETQTLLSDLGLGSAILIPIARSNIHNVLVAGRDAAVSQFRGADLELFFVLARQAIVAMENARLYADLREYVRRVEESQQALLRAEKMAAAGRLTASIAHEVNNPLQSVQNCLHLAGHEDVPPEKRREYFDLARTELDRLMKTMQRMLDFYRPGASRVEEVDILELLKHVINLTSQQLGQRNIQMITDLPESLPMIYVVSGQIQQIFFNLILNALDAMPMGGELKISARPKNRGIELIFADNGPGIPETQRNNIFEPFFSTKDGGTGLGLTVSYNIVTAHGGTLDLVDRKEPGACFRLFLPSGNN